MPLNKETKLFSTMFFGGCLFIFCFWVWFLRFLFISIVFFPFLIPFLSFVLYIFSALYLVIFLLVFSLSISFYFFFFIYCFINICLFMFSYFVFCVDILKAYQYNLQEQIMWWDRFFGTNLPTDKACLS